MKEICKARFEAFGTAGNASKLKRVSIEDMAVKYANGKLDPESNKISGYFLCYLLAFCMIYYFKSLDNALILWQEIASFCILLATTNFCR